MSNPLKPILLFAFADRTEAHLTYLKQESSQLMEVMSTLHDDGDLEIHREESTRVEDVPRLLIRFDQRICLFHYAGHAGAKGLLLEEGAAHAKGLA